MSEFLGKTHFSQGLTTNTRGVYGNNAVLNECHGFDINNGDLVPVSNVGEEVASANNINSFTIGNDYVTEFNGKYYSFSDFKNKTWTVDNNVNVSVDSFFGGLTLMSKPCVSDRFIIYPTNKGLLSFEPEAKGGKTDYRYLSFMSPDDYDKYENTTLYPKTGNDYKNHHIKVENETVSKTQVFTTSGYTTTNCSVSNDTTKISISCSDSGLVTTGKPNGYFEVKKNITLTSGYTKGWLIYDLRIENDSQDYNIDRSFFENGDATISGYEIVFGKTVNNVDTDVYVIGVPKVETVENKWYRCASYVEMTQAELSSVTWVKFRTSKFFFKSDANNPIVHIGIQNKDVVDTKDQWRFIGNYFYPYEQALSTSSYKDKLKRNIDNKQQVQKDDNELVDYNCSKGGIWCTWSDSGDNWIDSNWPQTITLTNDAGVQKTFTTKGAVGDKFPSNWKFATQPVSTYSSYIFSFRMSGDGEDSTTLRIKFPNKSKNDVAKKFYGAGPHQIRFDTYDNNTCEISLDYLDTGGYWTEAKNFVLFKVSIDEFYKTSRVLYDYLEDDVQDDKKFIHNQKQYAYSFCGRNRFNYYNSTDSSKDKYKLMISNSSSESDKIADNPFVSTTISINTLPVKTINNIDRNVLNVYNDYFTDILIYKSFIYGQTLVQEDFSFCGKINKNWTEPDTSQTPRRFKDNYMTSTGFTAKDNCSYEEDEDTDTYYDIDDWHAVDPQQEIYNDFLEQANCVCHLNGRLFAGNIGRENDVDLQPTSLAVSNYDENWIFPTSVDEGSITGTGTQTDNLHSVSNKIDALATVNDRVLIFYDKEILSLYGNDFYSSNGFGIQNIGRLNVIYKTIANTIREVVFSDGKDFYITNGGQCQNISKFKINTKGFVFTNSSAMFYDNRYFLLEENKIYVYDMYTNGWWTFDKQDVKYLIDYITTPMCVIKNSNNQYRVANLFGGNLEGHKYVETMYQILSDTQADVIVNDFAIECDCDKKDLLDITLYGKGEFIEEWKRELEIDNNHFRYNKKVRFNKAVNSIKQRIDYEGGNPPTIYAIGVIRNGTKARE